MKDTVVATSSISKPRLAPARPRRPCTPETPPQQSRGSAQADLSRRSREARRRNPAKKNSAINHSAFSPCLCAFVRGLSLAEPHVLFFPELAGFYKPARWKGITPRLSFLLCVAVFPAIQSGKLKQEASPPEAFNLSLACIQTTARPLLSLPR